MKRSIVMKNLKGKTAVVTGASSGIGAAIAKELAKEGANVVLVARTLDKLNEVENDINALKKGKAHSVIADVSNKEDVDAMVSSAKEAFGHIYILVNNAGQMLTGAVRSGKVDRKSTRLNSSHVSMSYAVFCLKKKQ